MSGSSRHGTLFEVSAMPERTRTTLQPLSWAGVLMVALAARPAFGQVQGYPIESTPAPGPVVGSPVVGSPVAPVARPAFGRVQGYPIEPAAPAPPVVGSPVEPHSVPAAVTPACPRGPSGRDRGLRTLHPGRRGLPAF